MTMDDIFIQSLFMNGYEAISSFLGYDYPEDENKDVTENRIQEVVMQMPEKEYNNFFTQNVKGVIAYNIKWDVDFDDFFETINEMTDGYASEALGCSIGIYREMNEEKFHDFVYEFYENNKDKVYEIMELPTEVEISSGLFDDEEVSDWLSDEYGFCHAGFELKAK